MRTAGILLVTRGQVTLGRGIVVIAGTEAYGRTYGHLQTLQTSVYFGSPLSLAYEDSDGDSE